MRNFYGVIETDNYVILNTLQNFISKNILFLFINLDKKHAKPNIGKFFKTNIILITKYPNLNLNIEKRFIFYQKMIYSK